MLVPSTQAYIQYMPLFGMHVWHIREHTSKHSQINLNACFLSHTSKHTYTHLHIWVLNDVRKQTPTVVMYSCKTIPGLLLMCTEDLAKRMRGWIKGWTDK